MPRHLPALLVLALAACGGGRHEEADVTVAADTAATDTTNTEAAPTLDFHPVWVRAAQVDFPHGPHQRLECTGCHVSVPNHRSHADVTCRDCHTIPAEVARTTVPDESGCLNCHHVQRRALACATCHQRDEIVGVRTVANPMRVAAWNAPRERHLTFDHAWHDTLACRSCHEESATNTPSTTCRSCHASHHTPSATCSRCHQPAAAGVHGDAVHQGCGGAGCHTNADALRLPPTRTLCLTCHPAQVNHEPGGDCATCHGIVPAWRTGGAP